MMLAGGLMTFSACSDDEWAPGAEQTEGARAYLYADASSYTFLPDDEQSITFHVARADASTDATVGLSVDAEVFSVPASISFAAGEEVKDVQVTFDIPIGSSATATVSISESDTYIYGASQLTLNITRDYTWQSQGTWLLTSSFYGGQGTTNVYKAAETDLYKAVAPYEEGYDLLFNVDGTNVTIAEQAVATDYGGYGTLYVAGVGTLTDSGIEATFEFFVSAGSFGVFAESFTRM